MTNSMNYESLVRYVNNMFDDKIGSSIFWRTASNGPYYKNICDLYYVAKDVDISKDVKFYVAMPESGTTNRFFPILGKTTGNKAIKDILYINDMIYIMYIIPEDLIEGKMKTSEAIPIIYDLYNYMINNSSPYIDQDSIYGVALNALPLRLTIYTIRSWFSDIKDEDFACIIKPTELGFAIPSDIDERVPRLINLVSKLSNFEPGLINYSAIYALVKEHEKECPKVIAI